MDDAKKNKIEITMAVTAIVVSVISFIISFSHSQSGAKTEIKPVLVFVYEGEEGWFLRNVGNGPALNVVVAMSYSSDGKWVEPVRIPAQETGGRFLLHWIGHSNVKRLGASYTDFKGEAYSTISDNDLSTVYDARKLPRWKDSDLSRDWWEGVPPGNRGDRRRRSPQN